MIFGQEIVDAFGNIAEAFPYLGTFTVVVVLIRIIVVRSNSAESAAVLAVKAAEERMLVEIDRAIKASEDKCNARLEAAEAECAEKVNEVKVKLDIIERGMRIIVLEYPENKTLQFLLSTLQENT